MKVLSTALASDFTVKVGKGRRRWRDWLASSYLGDSKKESTNYNCAKKKNLLLGSKNLDLWTVVRRKTRTW